MKKIVRNIPKGGVSATVVALILYASLDSNPFDVQQVSLFEGADKIIHALMYFSLAVALIFDWAKVRYPREVKVFGTVMCAVIAFGFSVAVEVMQDSMGLGRTASVGDGVANFVGATLGFLCMKYVFLQRFYRYMR